MASDAVPRGDCGEAPEAGAARAVLHEAELEAWGRRLGARAREAGLFVALYGPLGAGKTTLIRAACRGAGATAPVTSPTFTLVQRYASPAGPIHHADLYRLRGPEELWELGWDDLLQAAGPVFVEWAGRAGPELPADRWDVRLSIAEGGAARAVEADRRGTAPALPPLDPT